MIMPKGRLVDFFGLPPDESGMPQTAFWIDCFTLVPAVGDLLRLNDRTCPIVQVSDHKTRSCLLGTKLDGMGYIGVMVNEPADELALLFESTDHPWVTWTPKDELPWRFKTADLPTFIRLNENWNAHPNDAGLSLECNGSVLLARMSPNYYLHRQYANISEITIRFEDCLKYRVTPINDEGWYREQCRFSGLAPSWGEFYEVSGNTRDDMEPTPWCPLEGEGIRHFHFYLKDETLEVKAKSWVLKV